MSWNEGCESLVGAWGAFHRVRHDMEASSRDWPVAPAVRAFEIRRHLADISSFRESREAADLVLEVATLLKDGTVHVTHPRYFGLYIPSVRRVAVVAEALAAQFNPQLAAWSHAPAANEIERHTLAFLIERLGWDTADGGGCFTSGGMEANLTALLTALCDAFPTLRESGLTGLHARPRFYISDEAHHSFEKAATVTGLGMASLCRVPVDASLRIDVSALQRMIEKDRAVGAVPFLVVGTAGTTGSGAIDPLTALASLAEKHGLWFHVDAAWGGFARLSPMHRDHLDGTGLSVFMALAELGAVGVATQIDHQFRMGSRLRCERQARGWDVVNSTPLPVVCFTRTGLPRTESALDQRLAPLLARGQVWISKVSLPGQGWVLRACITSFLTDESDLKILLDELDALRSS